MASSIRKLGCRRHAKTARNGPVFDVSNSQPSLRNDCTDSTLTPTPSHTEAARACVTTLSPDRYSSTRSPQHVPSRRHGRDAGSSCPSGTRGRPFPCQARMQPCFAVGRSNRSALPGPSDTSRATGNAHAMPSHCHAGIDLQGLLVIHYWLPRAILGPLRRGAKGVAVVTCPSSPAPEPGWRSPPEAPAPRFHFVVHVPLTHQPLRWALPEARQAIDPPTRHPMPAPDPAIAEHACIRRKLLCLPLWAPGLSPLKRSSPPWTFGQGWTHASGWRCEFKD